MVIGMRPLVSSVVSSVSRLSKARVKDTLTIESAALWGIWPGASDLAGSARVAACIEMREMGGGQSTLESPRTMDALCDCLFRLSLSSLAAAAAADDGGFVESVFCIFFGGWDISSPDVEEGGVAE